MSNSQESSIFAKNRRQLSLKKKASKKRRSHHLPPESIVLELQRLYFAKRFQEAEQVAASITKNFPNHQFSWTVLASIYHFTERLMQSIDSWHKVIKLDPQNSEARFNLGKCLQRSGNLNQARITYNSAIKLDPKNPHLLLNLGITLHFLQRFEDAVICFQKAISLNASFTDAHRYLGLSQSKLGLEQEAILSFENAYSLNPAAAYVLSELVLAKKKLCDWSKLDIHTKELFKRIENGEPTSTPFLLGTISDDPELIRKGTELYANDKFPMLNTLPEVSGHPDKGKIKVAYYSPDFHDHPLSKLIVDLFSQHDRSKFEVHAFSWTRVNDKWTREIREKVDIFHNINELSDGEACVLARSLEIDIAIDLAGFTGENRQGIFAMRSAPVQIGYLGFHGTTGTNYCDYLVSDIELIPEKNKKFFSEKIIYLPSYQVNSSQDTTPDRSLSLANFRIPEKSFVFGCFQNVYKFSPELVGHWAEILDSVTDSILLLYCDNKIAIQNLKCFFETRHIDPSRIIFVGHSKGTEFWSRFNIVDLCLDTFSANGGSTGSDTLRSGCPMLTCRGQSFGSRLGASLLNGLDMDELICSSPSEYVAKAKYLASNPKQLKIVKKKLLSKLKTELLFDVQQFTMSLEQAFTETYDRSQNNQSPSDIYIGRTKDLNFKN